MSARKTTITAFAILLGLAFAAAPSATAQLMEPATGWVPGQPYVLTISDSELEPMMVVYVGRIPLLSTGKRVRMLLPSLDRTGMVYAVSTIGDNDARRPPWAGPRKAREPQHVAGRVHTVVIPSPANPALGQAPGVVVVIDARGVTSHLAGAGPVDQATCSKGPYCQPGGVMDEKDDVLGVQPAATRRTIDGGRAEHHGIVPPPDPHGAERRMIRPPEVDPMRRLADGLGSLDTARNVLGGTGDRATTYDTGGAGIPEAAAAGDEPCSKGPWQTGGCASVVSAGDVLGVQPAAPRRTLDGGRPAGERVAPRDRGGVPRPIEDVPFVRKRGVPDTGGGDLGQARFPWHLGDQGHTLEGAMR